MNTSVIICSQRDPPSPDKQRKHGRKKRRKRNTKNIQPNNVAAATAVAVVDSHNNNDDDAHDEDDDTTSRFAAQRGRNETRGGRCRRWAPNDRANEDKERGTTTTLTTVRYTLDLCVLSLKQGWMLTSSDIVPSLMDDD